MDLNAIARVALTVADCIQSQGGERPSPEQMAEIICKEFGKADGVRIIKHAAGRAMEASVGTHGLPMPDDDVEYWDRCLTWVGGETC